MCRSTHMPYMQHSEDLKDSVRYQRWCLCTVLQGVEPRRYAAGHHGASVILGQTQQVYPGSPLRLTLGACGRTHTPASAVM